ncbi:MAG: aminotransferase class V-fold PLP-dependent enzyme [Anaerolineales bacterium]|nr:aminotransferase class V-fold PLP-dependent enzyme [Anaerolineales bacterium]
MNNLNTYFLLDPSVTFLNHGSFGATPRPVFEEYQRWQVELERQPVEFLGRRFNGLMAESRAALGEYLGSHADNLVYTQNVTVSMNIVARSLDLGAGDEVLASDHEYGAMDRTWRFLAKEHGFTYINQPVSLVSREAFIDSFWSAVSPRTRVIFLSHITSPTAVIFPLGEIIQRARRAGIITVIDGAHAPGQLSLDLDYFGPDFYGGNLHKWLCAPKGAGFLYARPEMQNLLKPLVVSWGYESLMPGKSTFVDHHEWWGTRDVAAFLSVPAAIKFQKDHDWENIRTECHKLVKDAQGRICELTGLAPLHARSDHWFAQLAAAQLPADTDLPALKIRLYDEFRIEIPLIEWQDKKLIRISVQGYNTEADIDRLLFALSKLVSIKP